MKYSIFTRISKDPNSRAYITCFWSPSGKDYDCYIGFRRGTETVRMWNEQSGWDQHFLVRTKK